MKKFTVLLLSALLALAPVALAEPFGNGESLSFSCLEGWYSAVSINDNLSSWQKMEEETGVHINWEAYSDYDNAMQLRIAAGSDLPDIMLISPSWSNSGVYKMALDGTIIQLDDLIDQYAPNIKKVLEDNPALQGMITAPDGHIYSICDTPMFVNDLVVQDALFMRKDWLDALNLEAPATIQQWHDVLAAFKDYDPTGTGAQAVPFSGSSSMISKLSVFATAYGLPSNCSYWWYDKDGKVYLTYTCDAFRDFLTEMSKWYDEGLIDMETRDESNFQSLVSTDVVGSFMTLSERVTQYNLLLSTGGFAGEHVLLNAPYSQDGLLTKRSPTWSHYGITKSCKNPELAIKWIDFVWGSDEGVTINEWGIEGKTFNYDENGGKVFTDFVLNNPDGLDPYNALRSLGSSDTILVRTPADVYEAMNSQYVIDYAKALLDQRVEPFPDVMATEDEQDTIDRIQNDLYTYLNESVEKFITGAMSLDEWDDYVSAVQSMGLDELLAIKQAQFDRSGYEVK